MLWHTVLQERKVSLLPRFGDGLWQRCRPCCRRCYSKPTLWCCAAPLLASCWEALLLRLALLRQSLEAWLLLLQEKEASLLRSLETANLAALQATRQALPQLPHPLALRSLLNGVMSGASAVRENLYDNVRSRSQRQQASEVSLRDILSCSIGLNTRGPCHLTEHLQQKLHLWACSSPQRVF